MKVAIWILRIIAALLALILAMYVIGILANLRDQPPSETAQAFLDEIENRPPLADEDNAYYMLFGFQVPAGQDPLAAGIARQQWLDQQLANGDIDRSTDPIPMDVNFQNARSTDINAVVQTCREATLCVTTLSADQRRNWIDAEPWLLERYHDLISMAGFREPVPYLPTAPIPNYGAALEGQRLWLLAAASAAQDGDTVQALSMLDDDLRFWRRTLSSSDLLISKMIAVAAVGLNFRYGNAVLETLSANGGTSVPPSWQLELTREERSIRRALAGEWFVVHSLTHAVDSGPDRYPLYWEYFDSALYNTAAWYVISPYLQPQDINNRLAASAERQAEIFDADFPCVARQYGRQIALDEEPSRPWWSMYNLVGRLLSIETQDYRRYGFRVADLEGLRRAALLANEMRNAGVMPDDVPAAIARSEIKDPYTGEALGWDAETREIVTTLLSDDRPERYRIRYEGPQAAPLAARQ